jgi:hypothetical protein
LGQVQLNLSWNRGNLRQNNARVVKAPKEELMHFVTAEHGYQLVAAIVLEGIILFELRAAVVALNLPADTTRPSRWSSLRPSSASRCCRDRTSVARLEGIAF